MCACPCCCCACVCACARACVCVCVCVCVNPRQLQGLPSASDQKQIWGVLVVYYDSWQKLLYVNLMPAPVARLVGGAVVHTHVYMHAHTVATRVGVHGQRSDLPKMGPKWVAMPLLKRRGQQAACPTLMSCVTQDIHPHRLHHSTVHHSKLLRCPNYSGV